MIDIFWGAIVVIQSATPVFTDRVDEVRKRPAVPPEPVRVNRAGFAGGSNSRVGWSPHEQDDEQVFP
ncbi:hypothetical protein [Caenispirillum bisanense]|uniref:Uncharacterized protein n=1 Tax=Caenispirillum bisanense TaxID=414052 RepID=A0A286H3A5_9PROT|nr:hypothetical protein [Caenispirillum bisanense]SOE01809.1 hypothetical protein SAMN05421508_12611 [Caenispirillum bisanense]